MIFNQDVVVEVLSNEQTLFRNSFLEQMYFLNTMQGASPFNKIRSIFQSVQSVMRLKVDAFHDEHTMNVLKCTRNVITDFIEIVKAPLIELNTNVFWQGAMSRCHNYFAQNLPVVENDLKRIEETLNTLDLILVGVKFLYPEDCIEAYNMLALDESLILDAKFRELNEVVSNACEFMCWIPTFREFETRLLGLNSLQQLVTSSTEGTRCSKCMGQELIGANNDFFIFDCCSHLVCINCAAIHLSPQKRCPACTGEFIFFTTGFWLQAKLAAAQWPLNGGMIAHPPLGAP